MFPPMLLYFLTIHKSLELRELSRLPLADEAFEDPPLASGCSGSGPEPAGSQPFHHSPAGQLLVCGDTESPQAFVRED